MRQASRFGFRAKGVERERAGVHVVGTHLWRGWRKDAQKIREAAGKRGLWESFPDIQSNRRLA